MVCIEILCQGKRIIFSSMYRPPSCNKEQFKQNLSVTLEKINNTKPHLNLIGADMNFGGNFDFYGTLAPHLSTLRQQKSLSKIFCIKFVTYDPLCNNCSRTLCLTFRSFMGQSC